MTANGEARILLVDDELNVLNSLRRLFASNGVDVLTAGSAEEAMAVLDQNSVDFILSDYKMPEVNGIQFLTMVRYSHPHVFRAILSGYVETDTITYAIGKGIAMAYFKKPWSDYDLVGKVLHIIGTVKLIQDKKFITIFNMIDKLPSVPKIYYLIDDAVNASESIDKIASIIKKDVSLTAKIMQIGNSVFYSGKSHSTLEQAILMIGLNTIKEIVLMYKFSEKLGMPVYVMDKLSTIFCHGLKINKAAEHLLITSGRKYNKSISNTIGLLSCIGRITQLVYDTERYQKTVDRMTQDKSTYMEAECSLGYTTDMSHRVTCYILDLYNMPFDMIEILLYSNEPERVSQENRLIAYALNTAERLVSAVMFGREEDEELLESLKSEYIDRDKLVKTVQRIKESMHV